MGSGGGGSSGEVKYPDYVEEWHEVAITNAYSDTTTQRSNNPYSSASVYDPSPALTLMQNAVDDFDHLNFSASGSNNMLAVINNTRDLLYKWGGGGYDGLFAADDWTWYWSLMNNDIVASFITTLGWTIPAIGTPYSPTTTAPSYNLEVTFPTEYYDMAGIPGRPYTPSVTLADPALVAIDTTYIADEVDAAGDVIDDQIESDVLPRFEAGMRDLNAVNSSEFVIGKAIIEGMRDRDVMKLQADLRVRAYELYETSKQHYQELRMKKNEQMIASESLKAQAHDANEKNVLGYKGIEASFSKTYSDKMLGVANLSLEIDKLKAMIDGQSDTISKDLMIAEANFKTSRNREMLALLQQKIAGTGLLVERKHNDIIRGYELITRQLSLDIQWQAELAKVGVEAARMTIVAGKEKSDKIVEYSVGSAGWTTAAWQGFSNLLAAPGGGTAVNTNKHSSVASAIGGALGGAATGAMIGGSIPGAGAAGVGIGAAVGGVAGLLGGLF